MDVQIPNDWHPRPWQLDVLRAREAGVKRGAIPVHRRAGKTDLLLNMAAIEAHKRVGNYIHVFPSLVQARRAIWRGVDKQGRRFMDRVFPPVIRSTSRDNEMVIEFLNGSTWQLLGADDPGGLVAANYCGCVFDEAALYTDTDAWDYLRPILAENDGWAFFISTFRGRNHFYDLYHVNKANPDWYTVHLTADDTHEWDGTPLITEEAIEAERKAGMSEAMIRQEFYLDTTAAFSGAYYQRMISQMREAGRTGDFPWDASLPVYVAFDIGYSDHTVAVFFQALEPNKTVIIGSAAWQFTPANEIAQDIRKRFPWGTQIHTAVLPWDANRPGPAGDTWVSIFQTYRLAEEIEVLRKGQGTLHAEIAHVQQSLATTYVDDVPREFTHGKPNNGVLLDALAGYRTERIAKRPGVYSKTPQHSWESHWADAVRVLMVYRHGDMGLGGWHEAPDFGAQDKAARVAGWV